LSGNLKQVYHCAQNWNKSQGRGPRKNDKGVSAAGGGADLDDGRPGPRRHGVKHEGQVRDPLLWNEVPLACNDLGSLHVVARQVQHHVVHADPAPLVPLHPGPFDLLRVCNVARRLVIHTGFRRRLRMMGNPIESASFISGMIFCQTCMHCLTELALATTYTSQMHACMCRACTSPPLHELLAHSGLKTLFLSVN
jgi:hypothetical protein